MTEERAGQLALKIATHRAKKRPVRVDPKNRDHWVIMARKFDIKPSEAEMFFLRVSLPSAIGASTGGSLGGLQGIENRVQLIKCEKIALNILRGDSIELNTERTLEWLTMTARTLDIQLDELRELYAQYILPYIIGKIMNWDKCVITGSTSREH